MRYIVSYDIQKDKIRRIISEILSEYGVRIQYSVFECDLTDKKAAILKNKISPFISKKTDSVFFIPFCGKCEKKRFSVGTRYTIRKLKVIDDRGED